MTVEATRAPFVGLRHYEVDEADLFFGRASETMKLLSALLGNRLLVVSGPTGSGKSSLVRAGAIPALRRAATCLPVGRAVPHSTFPTLAAPDYNLFTFTLLSTWAPEQPTRALRSMTVGRFFESIPPVKDAYDEDLPLVGVIDGFDEVFSEIPAWVSQRDDFLEQLADALARVDRLHLVLIVDERALGAMLRQEAALCPDYRAHFRVTPLSREAALQALTEPFARRGRTFEPGVAEAVIEELTVRRFTNDLGTETAVVGDVDPAALQVVGTSLWHSLAETPAAVAHEHLERRGSLDTSLAALCANAVAGGSKTEGIPADHLWQWLGDTFITELGTRGTAYEGLTTTAGLPHSVAWAFSRQSILRSEKRLGAVWYELQHDLLINPIRRGSQQARATEAAEFDERAPSTLLRMAESALSEGRFSLAEEYATRAAATEGEGVPVLAEACALLGQILVQQALDATGERADELYRSAKRRYEDAMEVFQARNDSPAVAQMLVALGQLQRLRGRAPEALGLLRSALQRHRGDPLLYLELARIAEGSGDLRLAINYYGAVLDFAPDNIEALIGRGAVHARRGNGAAALADLDEAIRRHPHLEAREDVVDARQQAMSVDQATA